MVGIKIPVGMKNEYSNTLFDILFQAMWLKLFFMLTLNPYIISNIAISNAAE